MKDILGKRKYHELKPILGRVDFDDFVAVAYEDPEGYSIRVNPVNGETEMMVAGTRNFRDWTSNVYDTWAVNQDVFNKSLLRKAGYSKDHIFKLEQMNVWRTSAQRKYERIAKENHVDVIYGHSRGGALVADMRIEGVEKVGLDAAMASARNKDMFNLNEGGTDQGITGLFDYAIGLTGTNNHSFNLGSAAHKVWK